MVAAVRPTWGRVDLQTTNTRTSADLRSLYEVSMRRKPPMLNLEATPARRFIGPTANDRVLQWMQVHYARLSNATRICLLAIFAAQWAAPRSIGRIVTPIAALGCLPIIILSPLIMSADVLALLATQHEFWFFTITSANNWIIASILFDDARIAGCLACFGINMLAVVMDANFRTIVLGARTLLAWFPAILAIIAVCTWRIVDIDPNRFKAVIPENKIHFTLANWFLNLNTTLVIFFAKQTFRRRHVFSNAFLEDRIVPCSTIHWDLILRRMMPNNRSAVHQLHNFIVDKDDQVLRQSSSVLPMGEIGQTTSHHEPRASHEAWTSTLQPVRIVTPTLAFLDLRNSLIPWLTPVQRLSLFQVILLYTSGIVGLLLAAFTMYLPTELGSDVGFHDYLGLLSLPRHTLTMVPAGSLVCTTLFIGSFVGSYQRDILRALRHNFDFMFTSLQFHLGCLCLADMMHWDLRCLALVAWDLWFHWILLWDALVPEHRDRFCFKKAFGIPVLLTIMLGLVWIVYSLFFSSYDALDDRILLTVTWGSFDVTFRTSTFLVGRMTTVLTWSLRLVWKALRSHDDDLILIRGSVEYYTPMAFIPSGIVPAT